MREKSSQNETQEKKNSVKCGTAEKKISKKLTKKLVK